MLRRHERAAPEALLVPARRAIARLGTSRLREGYFTTFWLGREELRAARAPQARPLERLVAHLWTLARPPHSCGGAEWWLGRAYTNALPIGFHFDQDVKAARGLRHPLLSSVLFFNRVRGGQLAVTDQRAGRDGAPRPAGASALEVAEPRRNRYVIFDGGLFHGVLDHRGQTPGRASGAPRGRLRVTLVVNYWEHRPSQVPRFSESRAYPLLRRARRGR